MAILKLERSAIIALTVACALFMENLDGTVIATALPQIAESFAVSPVQLSLAITSYLLSVAIFIPASGWMADRFGARTVFRAAIAIFMLGSILCGLSGSIVELTGARILQGIGGAMMVPIGRLVLLRNVTKAELVRAMSYLTVPALLGPVLGPPVGGFIVTYASWPWIFFLNVPIGILGLVLVSILIENYKEPETPPFDLAGFTLTAIGLVGTMSGFEAIGRGGLPLDAALALAAIGLAALIFYVRHASRHPNPILVLLLAGGFFRSLQFTSTNTLAFADVPPTRISRATSMTSTAQQLSISMGVALGATLLHLTLLWRGTSELTATDFWPAFVAIALI